MRRRDYPLPRARATNYLDVSPVHAADLNALQDCSVYGRHGSFQWRTIIPRGLDDTDITADYTSGYSYSSSGSGVLRVPLQMIEGLTITDIAMRVYGTGAGGDITGILTRINGDGTINTGATMLIDGPVAASWATHTYALDPQIVAAAGQSYLFVVTFTAANQRVSALRYRAWVPV